jgi:Transglutaminase-like superfamily
MKTMRRRYLWEAVIMIIAARFAVRFLRSTSLLAWAQKAPQRPKRFAVEEIDWVAWAVETIRIDRRISAPSVAYALAAQCMLRRRGIASRFCLRTIVDGQTSGTHAWLEREDTIIVGAADASCCTRPAELAGAHEPVVEK